MFHRNSRWVDTFQRRLCLQRDSHFNIQSDYQGHQRMLLVAEQSMHETKPLFKMGNSDGTYKYSVLVRIKFCMVTEHCAFVNVLHNIKPADLEKIGINYRSQVSTKCSV